MEWRIQGEGTLPTFIIIQWLHAKPKYFFLYQDWYGDDGYGKNVSVHRFIWPSIHFPYLSHLAQWEGHRLPASYKPNTVDSRASVFILVVWSLLRVYFWASPDGWLWESGLESVSHTLLISVDSIVFCTWLFFCTSIYPPGLLFVKSWTNHEPNVLRIHW